MPDPKRINSRIAVLCSGGDSPGMNACVRAIVRKAFAHRVEVLGVYHGYRGLIEGELSPLSLRGVGNLIQRGGTFLGSSRSPDFRKKGGRQKAYAQLQSYNVDRLIVLGGDGSLAGAHQFAKEFPIKVFGIPCSIDNDLWGTDFSVGFETAVQNAVRSIDQIRDTADSHGRVFLVEVMGKNTGHIAIETALAVGAEFVVIPEAEFRFSDLVKKIKSGIQRGKTGSIVIVAERQKTGFVLDVAKKLEAKVPAEVRSMILGHIQRGGSPSAFDRNLASRFGAFAVEEILKGKTQMMTAIEHKKLKAVSLARVVGKKKKASLESIQLMDDLSV